MQIQTEKNAHFVKWIHNFISSCIYMYYISPGLTEHHVLILIIWTHSQNSEHENFWFDQLYEEENIWSCFSDYFTQTEEALRLWIKAPYPKARHGRELII